MSGKSCLHVWPRIECSAAFEWCLQQSSKFREIGVQGAVYDHGKGFVETFVKCSIGWGPTAQLVACMDTIWLTSNLMVDFDAA